MKSENRLVRSLIGSANSSIGIKRSFYLDKATDTFLPYPPVGSKNNPHKIFQDKEGRFWICTWGDGLYRFYPDKQGQAMYEYINLPDDKNFSLGIYFGIEQDDINGYIWVMSYAGVTVFTMKNDPFFHTVARTVPLLSIWMLEHPSKYFFLNDLS
ncbi:MAG: hypothetical protein FWD60_13890, partial [Candidatus Azobacteroides sp.]|nr:hypothetical protein [Candidatus Azobacteroides sp.]